MALLMCQCWLWEAVWHFFQACPEAQAQQLPLWGDAAGWPHNRLKKGRPVLKHWKLTEAFNQLGPEDTAAAAKKLKHMKCSPAESDPRELQQPHWGEQSLSCLPTSTFLLNTQGLKLLILFWYAGRGSVWKVSSICTEHKQFHKAAAQHGPPARPEPAPAPRDVALTLLQSKLHILVEQFSEI